MIGICISVSVYLRIKNKKKQKYGLEPLKQMRATSDQQEWDERDEDEPEWKQ